MTDEKFAEVEAMAYRNKRKEHPQAGDIISPAEICGVAGDEPNPDGGINVNIYKLYPYTIDGMAYVVPLRIDSPHYRVQIPPSPTPLTRGFLEILDGKPS